MIRSLAFLALLPLALAGPAWAQDDDSASLDDVPHVTMVGIAQMEVAPDLATITLGVTSEAKTAKAAADDNAQKAQAVVAAAKAEGIASADITTQRLTLRQTFDDIRDAQGHVTGRRPRGFAAENIVSIKVREIAKAAGLAGSLVQNGANRFDGIDFTVEHPEPLATKLMGDAVRNAKAQAQVAAEASSSRLGRVLLIGKPDDGQPVYRARVMARAPAPAAAAPPIEAGTTTLTQSVAVTWALEPN